MSRPLVALERPRVCRGCGGDGLSPYLTPREVQVARLPFHLHNGGTGMREVVWRGNVSERREESLGSLAAPLAVVLDEAHRLRLAGWTLVGEADMPDRFDACGWCDGYGTWVPAARTM